MFTLINCRLAVCARNDLDRPLFQSDSFLTHAICIAVSFTSPNVSKYGLFISFAITVCCAFVLFFLEICAISVQTFFSHAYNAQIKISEIHCFK